jgi:hypothetical protein
MIPKTIAAMLVALALGLICVGPAIAADPTIHEGTVMSAGAGKLVMKDSAGKELSHTISTETKITVHGKPGKLEELKMGMRIKVMTAGKDKVLAVSTVDDEK